MKTNKKAQSAIEFMILVGFVFFAFTIFIMSVQLSNSNRLDEEKNLRIKEIVISVQDEINLAYYSSNGYQREFKIPESINNIEYEINITEGLVYLKTNDGQNAIALPIQNITGNILKGNNLIKKDNGVVNLNI